ncbi:MAG: enoyl-CoA hydratase [Gemmatimonadetes bacterium]|nr:enoyl-CoA hydratase [Gemmatimonadota bacterium]
MSDRVVTTEQDGAVGTITLNRPKANSYNLAFMEDLNTSIDEMISNHSVKTVVMKSALDGFFSAGADIKAFRANTTEENMKMIRFAHATLRKMGDSSKVFIAAIGGHTLGGGLEIALACDLRTAGDGPFRMGLPEVTLGLLPGNGGTQRLPRLIGRTRALSMMLTGETVPPARAHELGFVDWIFPQDSYLADTLVMARKLATGATVAMASIKRCIFDGMEMPLSEALDMEREAIGPLFDTDDAKEGFAAFAEKRKAVFTGR